MSEQPWILTVRNFVFSGGAQKGNAFLGALQILEEIWSFCGKNLFTEIEGYAGSSIGALISLACAMQMPVKDIREWFLNQGSTSLMSEVDVTRFYSHCGLLRTDLIRTRVLELMRFRFRHPDKVTFLEFHRNTNKNLKVVTTNISRGVVQIFDHHHSPKAIVADAITMSMAVPFLFEPVEYILNENSQESDFYIDGALYNNYPITLFPSNTVLGFRVRGRNILSKNFTMKEYAASIMMNTMDFYEDKILKYLSREYQERTMTIPLPPCTFWEMMEADRSLRESYIQQGEQTMMNFLFRGFFMGRMLLWLISEMQSEEKNSDNTTEVSTCSPDDDVSLVDERVPAVSCLLDNTQLSEELPSQNTEPEEHKRHTSNFEYS